MWPGIDYSNIRISDFKDPVKIHMSDINQDDPRLPWHDIAMRIIGGSVIDLSRHFVQYWEFV